MLRYREEKPGAIVHWQLWQAEMKKILKRCKSIFDILGSTALLIGGSGSGSVTKLANQIIVNNTIAVVSEAFVLAAKYGSGSASLPRGNRGGLARKRSAGRKNTDDY